MSSAHLYPATQKRHLVMSSLSSKDARSLRMASLFRSFLATSSTDGLCGSNSSKLNPGKFDKFCNFMTGNLINKVINLWFN